MPRQNFLDSHDPRRREVALVSLPVTKLRSSPVELLKLKNAGQSVRILCPLPVICSCFSFSPYPLRGISSSRICCTVRAPVRCRIYKNRQFCTAERHVGKSEVYDRDKKEESQLLPLRGASWRGRWSHDIVTPGHDTSRRRVTQRMSRAPHNA